jgi:hypothetical protein
MAMDMVDDEIEGAERPSGEGESGPREAALRDRSQQPLQDVTRVK